MPNFLLTWLLTALALVLTGWLVPGITLDGFNAAIIAAAVLGLVNAVVKPLLILLTLPLTFLTLGLFLLVINAISIMLVASLTPGFAVSGFLAALVGSIVLSLVSTILGNLVEREDED
ncbi:phage holin family protein [Geitlerinema sp. PCC 9228]|jgi:putative membrane protein|uniref:phage holin family protein n=1 Tax=Geitlerinema sp. PCC 9228 TaxID=111611 RepID=UPI0008F9DDDC|nr:phage holin family protein [Geitlerinema sp. PCC 9228]